MVSEKKIEIWIATPEKVDQYELEDVSKADKFLEWAGKKLIRITQETLENMASSIINIGNTIIKESKTLIKEPKSTEIEFGISFHSDGKIIVVEAGGTCNIKIKFVW